MKKTFNIETLTAFLEDKQARQEFEQEKLVADFTEELARIKESRGLSNKEFAKALGYSPSYISQLLSGERNISLRTAAKIMFKLGKVLEFSFVPVGCANRFQFLEKNEWDADVKSMWAKYKSIETDGLFIRPKAEFSQGWRSNIYLDNSLIDCKGQGNQ
jgi:transcriptional regulator with XRE-family HTH domain